MAYPNPSNRRAPCRHERGLTLIEFMVSITIGLIMVAALATLIADQSGNRAEVDRAGRLIENGRYGIRVISEDLQLAGYWGELNAAPESAALAALPNPCSLAVADITSAAQLHVQGYSAADFTSAPTTVPTCISNLRSGSDILVVRHADPDFSSLLTGANVDLTKLTDGQLYIQTGLNAASANFTSVVNIGDAASNATTFSLKKKDMAATATVRKVVVRIYYVANCSVQVGSGCTGADSGNPIPTLKMLELTVAGGAATWSNPVTIAEGIETMQIDYGVDTDGDGAPNDADVNGSALAAAAWADVMAVKIHLVARALERTPGFDDRKTYALGTAGSYTPATADRGYKRQLLTQSVRLVNPSSRRSS